MIENIIVCACKLYTWDPACALITGISDKGLGIFNLTRSLQDSIKSAIFLSSHSLSKTEKLTPTELAYLWNESST